MKKTAYFFSLTLMCTLFFSFKFCHKPSTDIEKNLIGNWTCYKMESGAAEKLDKEIDSYFGESPEFFGIIHLSFEKNHNYTKDEGCYALEGKYRTKDKQLFISYNDSPDHSYEHRILHVDKDYLVISRLQNNPVTFFYKRR